MESAIRVRSLTKAFGKNVALEGIDFQSHPGINIILGPNGAGKSTLLKCIDGLYRPEKGSVRVFGQDPYTNDGLKSRLSLLTENYALYDFLTVMQNMSFFGRLYGLRDDDIAERTKEVLGQLNASEYIGSKVYTLSRGTKQKVALCRALLNDPEILMMDEPTAFLDAYAAQAIRDLMLRFTKERKTVLFVTQKIDEVTRYNGMITVLRKGRIVKQTTTEGLYRSLLKDSYVNVRVARPIGIADARHIPFFAGTNQDRATFLKFKVSSYKDINIITGHIAKMGSYVVSVDYTEPFIEDLSV